MKVALINMKDVYILGFLAIGVWKHEDSYKIASLYSIEHIGWCFIERYVLASVLGRSEIDADDSGKEETRLSRLRIFQ